MHALTAQDIEKVEAEIDHPLSRERLVESLVHPPPPSAERPAEPPQAGPPAAPSHPGDPGQESESPPP